MIIKGLKSCGCLKGVNIIQRWFTSEESGNDRATLSSLQHLIFVFGVTSIRNVSLDDINSFCLAFRPEHCKDYG